MKTLTAFGYLIPMARIAFLALLTAVFGCHAPGFRIPDSGIVSSRPNIVFMLSDDMGWADPSFNGGRAELMQERAELALLLPDAADVVLLDQ